MAYLSSHPPMKPTSEKDYPNVVEEQQLGGTQLVIKRAVFMTSRRSCFVISLFHHRDLKLCSTQLRLVLKESRNQHGIFIFIFFFLSITAYEMST